MKNNNWKSQNNPDQQGNSQQQENPMQGYDRTARNFQRPNDENDEGEMEEVSDSDPALTEDDLEENHLTDEEADEIEWDEGPGDRED